MNYPTDGGATPVDGNVLAGPLGEIFAVDVTVSVSRCGGCGQEGTVAQLVVYGPDPGWVGRCPGCSAVVLRVVRAPDEAWLDLSGCAALRLRLTS